MAFNHSDTDRIAVYPNRPPKTNCGVLVAFSLISRAKRDSNCDKWIMT